jgi:hypothetical protein
MPVHNSPCSHPRRPPVHPGRGRCDQPGAVGGTGAVSGQRVRRRGGHRPGHDPLHPEPASRRRRRRDPRRDRPHLTAIVAERGGHLLSTAGDSFAVAFLRRGPSAQRARSTSNGTSTASDIERHPMTPARPGTARYPGTPVTALPHAAESPSVHEPPGGRDLPVVVVIAKGRANLDVAITPIAEWVRSSGRSTRWWPHARKWHTIEKSPANP